MPAPGAWATRCCATCAPRAIRSAPRSPASGGRCGCGSDARTWTSWRAQAQMDCSRGGHDGRTAIKAAGKAVAGGCATLGRLRALPGRVRVRDVPAGPAAPAGRGRLALVWRAAVWLSGARGPAVRCLRRGVPRRRRAGSVPALRIRPGRGGAAAVGGRAPVCARGTPAGASDRVRMQPAPVATMPRGRLVLMRARVGVAQPIRSAGSSLALLRPFPSSLRTPNRFLGLIGDSVRSDSFS